MEISIPEQWQTEMLMLHCNNSKKNGGVVIMKATKLKGIGIALCLLSTLNAEVLEPGLHLVGAEKSYTLNVGDFREGVKTIYAINDSKTGYKSFLPSNVFDFLNSLRNLEADKGYLIQVDSIFDFQNYKYVSAINECSVNISEGLNIIPLPAKESLPAGMDSINGAKIKAIYAINDSKTGYKSYLPTNSLTFLNTLNSIEDGKYYLVLAESPSTGVCMPDTTVDTNTTDEILSDGVCSVDPFGNPISTDPDCAVTDSNVTDVVDTNVTDTTVDTNTTDTTIEADGVCSLDPFGNPISTDPDCATTDTTESTTDTTADSDGVCSLDPFGNPISTDPDCVTTDTTDETNITTDTTADSDGVCSQDPFGNPISTDPDCAVTDTVTETGTTDGTVIDTTPTDTTIDSTDTNTTEETAADTTDTTVPDGECPLDPFGNPITTDPDCQ